MGLVVTARVPENTEEFGRQHGEDGGWLDWARE